MVTQLHLVSFDYPLNMSAILSSVMEKCNRPDIAVKSIHVYIKRCLKSHYLSGQKPSHEDLSADLCNNAVEQY